MTSSQSEASLQSCLESLKSILPSHTFGNQGPETGTDIFMTDDDTAQRHAVRSHWKHATLLLCIFHFMQATWRWLLDSKHSISKDDRQHLMTTMQDLVFAKKTVRISKNCTAPSFRLNITEIPSLSRVFDESY